MFYLFNKTKISIILLIFQIFLVSCSTNHQKKIKTKHIIGLTSLMAITTYVGYKYFYSSEKHSSNKNKKDNIKYKPILKNNILITQKLKRIFPIWKLSGRGIKTSYICGLVHYTNQEEIVKFIKEVEQKYLKNCEAFFIESLPYYYENDKNILNEMYDDIINKFITKIINYPQNETIKSILQNQIEQEISILKSKCNDQFPNYAFFPLYLFMFLGSKFIFSPDIYLCKKANELNLKIDELDSFVNDYVSEYKKGNWLPEIVRKLFYLKPLYNKFHNDINIANDLKFYKKMIADDDKMSLIDKIFNNKEITLIDMYLRLNNTQITDNKLSTPLDFVNDIININKKRLNKKLDSKKEEQIIKILYDKINIKKILKFYNAKKECELLNSSKTNIKLNPFNLYKFENDCKFRNSMKNLLSPDNIKNRLEYSFETNNKSTKSEIIKRDKKWLPKILNCIKQNKTFISCGGAHIYDLLKLLENEEIEIELCPYNN